MKDLAHKAGVLGCIAVAGIASRMVLERAWELKSDKPAPKNPAAPDVSWKEALAWGATAGVVAGLVRTAVRRGYADMSGIKPDPDL